MTLFIGIVATSMEEAKAEGKENAKQAERFQKRRQALKINNNSDVLEIYRTVFDELDVRGETKIDREAIKFLVKCIALLDTFREKAGKVETTHKVRRSPIFLFQGQNHTTLTFGCGCMCLSVSRESRYLSWKQRRRATS